ncbi:MAG: hypothetical protein P4L99_27740 [Chthoniobacter sp.]|nr:hypothetical protein [Chthoniobacter sp.]
MGAGIGGAAAFGAESAVGAVAAGALFSIPVVAAATPSSTVGQIVNIAEKFEISKTSLTTALGEDRTTFPPVRPTRLAIERRTRSAALLMKLMPAISSTNAFPPALSQVRTSVSNLGDVVPSSRPWTIRMEHSPRFSFVNCIGLGSGDQRDF